MSQDEPLTNEDMTKLMEKLFDPMYGTLSFVAECRNYLATVEKLGQLYEKTPNETIRENTRKTVQKIVDCAKKFRSELKP